MEIIKVPATSANLGPGFDSLGIAVNVYLTVTIAEQTANWVVEHQLGSDVPTDERNMIVQTALSLVPNLTPHRIIVDSDIPLARGLGSSSSAIVAGLEIANIIGKLDMDKETLLQKATYLEGHPDNVAPAILGDFVVSAYVSGHVTSVKGRFPELEMLAYIPKYELPTSKSREALPKELPFKEAVAAGSIGNALVASLLTERFDEAGRLMEADRYHEIYRAALVPHLATLREIGHHVGAMATYLSGAGPTVMTIVDKKKVPEFIRIAREAWLDGDFRQLNVDRNGVVVEKK
ncbi:homoserine kinase [Ligilactobacillus sp. WILCCON 0076]|uniref:Homoserine kinase n=1 Tax=Ligilactobacillus ubinensis TaxID=2876789 RepID=A0A9X2FLU8_9LACO|nr:homoserine kinase [Ligilactobacillus ubinensis]MCP0887604.1 homoserine kinase [Ligilactobacillus ubinensis]